MDYKIGGLEPTQLIVIAARPSVGRICTSNDVEYS